MSPFEFLTVALSFVLGLAVTLLLMSFLDAFRARHVTRMSWVPLTWAAYVLVMQFDLWWEVYGLSSLDKWSVGAFVLLLVVALSLFAAGGLVLPAGSNEYPPDLGHYFAEDGRWGVGMVVVFLIVGSVANVALFDLDVFGSMNLFNAVGLALATVVVVTSQPLLRAAGTVLFGVYLASYLWTFVPRTY